MAENDPQHASGRQDGYLRACEGILRTRFGRRPFTAAARAIEQLEREERQKSLGTEKALVLRWWEAVALFRGRAWVPLSAAALLAVLGAGLFFVWHGRAPQRIEIGKFTAVMGAPKLEHTDQRSTLKPWARQSKATAALRSTAVRLGDRIETGDADKAEIQFNDGTTLRMNFNTTVEISNPKSEIRNPKSERHPESESRDRQLAIGTRQSAVSRSNGSTVQRPAEIKLLLGQIWTKVQKTTNAPQFAVRTPVASAVVRGTEFGLKLQKLQKAQAANQGQPSTLNPQPSTLQAVLAVKEGAVEFSNSFGRVEATAMTESVAQTDAAPTEPKRLQNLRALQLAGTFTFFKWTAPLTLPEAANRLLFPLGWAGLSVKDVEPAQPSQAAGQPPAPKQARVVRVMRASPAEKAGLQVGDVIIALDGNAVTDAVEVETAVATRPQALMTLTVSRVGQVGTVTLTTTWPPDPPPIPALSRKAESGLYQATGLLLGGRTAEAEAALKELLATEAAAAVHNNLGVLYETKDEMARAIRHYQEATQAEPLVALYHFNLAMALKNIGNFERAAEELETAVSLAPKWVEPRRWLADVYGLLDRHEEALKAVESALNLNPNSPDGWVKKCDVLIQQLRAEEALAAIHKAIELGPTFADAYDELSLLYHARHQFPEAEEACLKTIELDPNSAFAYRRLGSIYWWRQQYDEAEKMGRKALALSPYSYIVHLDLGLVYGRQGKLDQAQAMYRKAIELDPQNPAGYAGVAGILAALGQPDEAEKMYRLAIKLDPRDGGTYHAFAWYYMLRRQFDEAERMWLKAIELSPQYSLPYRSLGALYQNQGKLDKAQEMYRKALDLEPNNAEFYVRFGELYRDTGQLDAAEKLFSKALELDPKNHEVYVALGTLYTERRQFAEAEKMYLKAVGLNPKSLSAMASLASFLDKQGRTNEAEEVYRRLLGMSPNDHWVLNSLAWFLAQHGTQLDEALSLAQRAVQAKPDNAASLDTLGWTHFKRDELAEAETTLKKALERFGEVRDAAPAWEHLGQVYEKKGQREAALEAYRKALSLQPDNKEAKDALDRLEK